MSEFELDAKQIEKRAHDLARSMDRIRSAQADRDDVVVEMKQATRARLELLARALQPLLKEIPENVDLFDFGLSTGEPPRLWIDATTHVRMGRDRRMYELVKDTRLGRTLLAQSSHQEQMAEFVTDYVAERLLERERTLEGEWLFLKQHDFDQNAPSDRKAYPKFASPRTGVRSFIWFMAGIFTTAALMFAWAWFGEFPAP